MITAASGLFYASYVALWVLVTTLALIMIVLLRHLGWSRWAPSKVFSGMGCQSGLRLLQLLV